MCDFVGVYCLGEANISPKPVQHELKNKAFFWVIFQPKKPATGPKLLSVSLQISRLLSPKDCAPMLSK